MLTFEKVERSADTSFTCYLRKESVFPFEWHYHPEYELVALISGQGRRFIGDSVEDYVGGDLVMTGSDLPHTWQSNDHPDSEQEAVVVQFSYDFLGESLFEQNEFTSIRNLLSESKHGLLFSGSSSSRTVVRLRRLVDVSGMERLLELLSILNDLAHSVRVLLHHQINLRAIVSTKHLIICAFIVLNQLHRAMWHHV